MNVKIHPISERNNITLVELSQSESAILRRQRLFISWDPQHVTGILLPESGYLLEGLVKIRDQIIDMLDPHRDPDQGVGQPDLFP